MPPFCFICFYQFFVFKYGLLRNFAAPMIFLSPLLKSKLNRHVLKRTAPTPMLLKAVTKRLSLLGRTASGSENSPTIYMDGWPSIHWTALHVLGLLNLTEMTSQLKVPMCRSNSCLIRHYKTRALLLLGVDTRHLLLSGPRLKTFCCCFFFLFNCSARFTFPSGLKPLCSITWTPLFPLDA